MKTVGITGALGIGRAHAIGAMNSNYKVGWVSDLPGKEEEVMDAYNKNGHGHVVNQWGFIREIGEQREPILWRWPVTHKWDEPTDLHIGNTGSNALSICWFRHCAKRVGRKAFDAKTP